MSEEKKAPSLEFLEASLGRLRKRLTYVQDEMDITAFAIRSIEKDIADIKEEDSNLETDA
jgi:hypothetical protein